MTDRDRGGMTYSSVEDIKEALDVLETARAEKQIKRVLRSATDLVEDLLSRRFYPEIRTQTFDWDDGPGVDGYPWTLWLDANEVISISSLTTGADSEVISPSDYFTKPDDGPPYTSIELDAESEATFEMRAGGQNSVTVTGTFGYWNEEQAAGTLAANVSSTTATTIDVSDGSLIGIGDLLKTGTERMVVTDRSFIDSTETITVALTSASSTTVTVSDGTAFNSDETILIDGERMLITDIAGNDLVVKRGWDGSTLASHAIAEPVYVSRRLTVTRGVLGTTAATHTLGDALTVHFVPPLVRNLCIAEALAQLVQERTAYARTIGKGEGESEVRGIGLADLRDRTVMRYGRGKARGRAI